MQEYYYLNGKEQLGPFSLDELQGKHLLPDTYIWTEGFEDWIKIKSSPELFAKLKPKSAPPPPPKEFLENQSSPEIKNVTVQTESSPTQTIPSPKPTKNTAKWLLIWCAFHLFALLFSYSGIGIFNQNACLGGSSMKTEKFWPFSSILKFEDKEPGLGSTGWCGYSDEKYFGNYIEFNGLFYNYDLTEFAFFVGGAILLFFLFKASKKEEKEISKA